MDQDSVFFQTDVNVYQRVVDYDPTTNVRMFYKTCVEPRVIINCNFSQGCSNPEVDFGHKGGEKCFILLLHLPNPGGSEVGILDFKRFFLFQWHKAEIPFQSAKKLC